MQPLVLLVVVAVVAAALQQEAAALPAQTVKVQVVRPAESLQPTEAEVPLDLFKAVQAVLPQGVVEAALLDVAAKGKGTKEGIAAREDTADETEEPVESREDTPIVVPKTSCLRKEKSKVLNNCMKQNFQSLVPYIKRGGKLGLPSLDPYIVPDINVLAKAGPVEFTAIMENMTVDGLSNVLVRDVRSDLKPDNMKLDPDLTFRKLTFHGNFEIKNGKAANIPFKGKGPFSVTFTNVVATWKLRGERKGDSKYMRVTSASPSYTVGGLNLWAENLVDKNSALNDLIVVLINRLWPEVVDIGKPFVQKTMSHHIRLLADSFFQTVPYDSLFPVEESPTS